MFERSRSRESVAGLMARVREEVEKIKLKHTFTANAESGNMSSSVVTEGSDQFRKSLHQDISNEHHAAKQPAFSFLQLQPEFRHERKNVYDLAELLQYHDRNFVRKAFLAILNREPTESELAQYLDDLRSGRCDKIDTIERLLRTPEGQAQGVLINGLRSPVTRLLSSLPILGYILRTLKGIIRLPIIMRNQQQFESYVLGQQQLIIDHVNDLRQRLIEHQRETSTILTEASEIVGVICESFAEQLKNEIQQNIASEINELASEGLIQQRQELEELIVQEQAVIVKSQKLVLNELVERLEEITHKQQQLKSELSLQERRLTRLLQDTRSFQTDYTNHQIPERLTITSDLFDKLLAAFEERLRGERADIKERLRVYHPIVAEARKRTGEALILDLGCGRGEWLEIAAEAGWQARGVEKNLILVERCKALSLDVVASDALAYLRTLPDASLSAITAFHLIEHLSFADIVELVDEALRVLKTEGTLIIESPNPKNLIVGACNFYSDPTHRQPLFPDTIEFLLNERGFTNVRIAYQNPAGGSPFTGEDEASRTLHNWFFGPRDFAIIADKP